MIVEYVKELDGIRTAGDLRILIESLHVCMAMPVFEPGLAKLPSGTEVYYEISEGRKVLVRFFCKKTEDLLGFCFLEDLLCVFKAKKAV